MEVRFVANAAVIMAMTSCFLSVMTGSPLCGSGEGEVIVTSRGVCEPRIRSARWLVGFCEGKEGHGGAGARGDGHLPLHGLLRLFKTGRLSLSRSYTAAPPTTRTD